MSNKNFTFITGGSRSGKSSHAQKLAEEAGKKRLYIATAQALDDEMAKRISRHQKERGKDWRTVEEPVNIAEVIGTSNEYEAILLDCLTLWLCNVMHEEESDEIIFEQIDNLVRACIECKTNLIVISNETGSGIIPGDPLSRRFSDLAGLMNQKMAAAANQVILTVSGIPLTIKG